MKYHSFTTWQTWGKEPQECCISLGRRGTPSASALVAVQLADDLEHFANVFARVEISEDVPQYALFVDDKGATLNSALHALFVRLLFQHFVHARYLALGVGKQLQGNPVFIAKLLVHQTIISRNPEDDGVALRKFILVIGKLDCFLGANGATVFRVKIQHDILFSAKGRQAYKLHAGVR